MQQRFMISCATAVVAMTAIASANESSTKLAQPGPGKSGLPGYPDNKDEVERRGADSGLAIPASAPEFSPATGTQLSAAFAMKSKEKLTTVTVVPFKLWDARPLWGLQLSVANDSGTQLTTFGVAYRAEWRWLLRQLYTDAFNHAYAEWSLTRGQPVGQLFRALDRNAINLIPVPSIGATVSVFPVDFEKNNQHTLAEQSVNGQLSWRFGTYVQVDVVGTLGTKRGAVDQMKAAHVQGLSSTAVVLVPELLGVTRYDDVYSEAGLFQRGIGLGVTLEYKYCSEDGVDQAICPDALTSSLLIGGVLDLKLAKDVAPRLIIGRRNFTKFTAGTMDEVRGRTKRGARGGIPPPRDAPPGALVGASWRSPRDRCTFPGRASAWWRRSRRP
ncbi:MAG TPA: hypothetical protein VHN14_28030 [Kofleriaceae bacterium]|jgi:hypothetical protein|nr:hypothetical protein [Kofleriaceae bacterium]